MFNSKAYYIMSELRVEIENNLKKAKGNKQAEDYYKGQLNVVNRCINSLYLYLNSTDN